MDWLRVATRTVADFIDRIPLEKMMVKPRDTTKDREELRNILKGAPPVKDKEPPQTKPEPEREHSIVSVRKSHSSGPTTEETVEYENREISKNLLQLEKHYAQKLTINGKRCDCGSSRHLLAIEAGCENAISMIDNPDVYYKLIEWVKEVGPKSSDEAARSGMYDEAYPQFSHQARDFRKELLGTEEISVLFPGREVQSEFYPTHPKFELPPGNKVEETPAPVAPEIQT